MNILSSKALSSYLKCSGNRYHQIKYLGQSSRSSSSTSSPQPPKIEEETKGEGTKEDDPRTYYYPNTSVGIAERTAKPAKKGIQPLQTPIPPFPDGKNPKTGETGGPAGPEPTRFGDWERKGRVSDF